MHGFQRLDVIFRALLCRVITNYYNIFYKLYFLSRLYIIGPRTADVCIKSTGLAPSRSETDDSKLKINPKKGF